MNGAGSAVEVGRRAEFDQPAQAGVVDLALLQLEIGGGALDEWWGVVVIGVIGVKRARMTNKTAVEFPTTIHLGPAEKFTEPARSKAHPQFTYTT